MKPILYDGSTTSYSGNGLGRLTDCISCIVTEERNGIYEAEFEYPLGGVHYDLITEGRIILVSHDEQKDLQPFEIYRISRPISGVVTVNCRHISYKLNHVIVSPYSTDNIATAIAGLVSHAMTPNAFTFWTDKTSTGSFSVDVPTAVRAILGGSEGSILDAFGGGEYEFDGYAVKLYAHRGADNGVTIRYGKNLTDIEAESDSSDLYNAVVPYWSDGSGQVVYGGVVAGDGGIIHEETWTDENNVPIQDEDGAEITFRAALRQVATMDLSGEFENAPTAAQLENRARSILNANEPWVPKVSIDVDFVALWQTEEYKTIAPLERVRLCDTVHVQYTALGVDATAKVIRVEWDALTERYSKIELGDAKTSFADVLMAETQSMMKEYPSTSMMQEAIEHATDLITGGMGGHIVFTLDANGEPIEQLIMDTPDKETAVNVWRWNLGGLGHSHSGYNGPFDDVALTQDGHINASMITVGTLNANIITAGTMSAERISGGELALGGTTDGALKVYNASGTEIISLSKTGASITKGSITLGNGAFQVTDAGILTMTRGSITLGTKFSVTDGGVLTATGASISGEITATSGEIGGFDITATAIKTKNVAITSNATNSIGLSSVNFTRTVGGTKRTNLRFAIGANFGVTGSGVLYASSANLTGTLTTTSGNQKTTVGSGKSSYYYQNALIGDSGANSANGENGIVFDLKTAGDYMGWFLNGTSNPILIYDKSDWLAQDIWSDCLNVVCDLHITDGATLAASRIADPSWRFSGADYAGYTGSITVGSRTLVFKNGVLTSA